MCCIVTSIMLAKTNPFIRVDVLVVEFEADVVKARLVAVRAVGDVAREGRKLAVQVDTIVDYVAVLFDEQVLKLVVST